MKRRFILLSIFILPVLSGCMRTYDPGIYHYRVPAMMVRMDNSTANYIGFDVGKDPGQYEKERGFMYRGHYTFAATSKYANINIGVFGYSGTYNVVGVDFHNKDEIIKNYYDGSKNYYGGGFELQGALNFNLHGSKLGIGFYGAFAKEQGSYTDFLQKASANYDIDVSNQSNCELLSIYPFLAIKLSERKSIVFQFAIGIPAYFSPNFIFNTPNYSLWVSFAQGPDNNTGVTGGFMLNLNQFFNY